MNLYERIIEDLKRHRACDYKNHFCNLEDAEWLLFSPQGREFCKKENWPDSNLIRDYYMELSPANWYVDTKVSTCSNRIVIAGNSDITLNASLPHTLFEVMIFGSAKLEINASEYAVVRITNIGNAEIEINNDGTSFITIE